VGYIHSGGGFENFIAVTSVIIMQHIHTHTYITYIALNTYIALHTYMHTYIHTYIHTYLHTYIHGTHSLYPPVLLAVTYFVSDV
jgi:hypothetical protein